MSSDLYERDTAEALSNMRPVEAPEPSVWKGFGPDGIGQVMRHAAVRSLSGLDLLRGTLPIAQDVVKGWTGGIRNGTEMQDRFFEGHDKGYGEWAKETTPDPGEVGMAAQVTGELLTMLPAILVAPTVAIPGLAMGEAEDLMHEGVSWGKALGVAGVTAAGLGVGFRLPILGRTLAERVLIGGAGANVGLGVAMRGGAAAILGEDKEAARYPMFDLPYIAMDLIMGAGFGLGAHFVPSLRGQGKGEFERLVNWVRNVKPSDIDALATLRTSQHLNVDSLPGIPAGPKDVQFHVERMRRAIDQLAQDKPVDVSDLPEPKFERDPVRAREDEQRFKTLVSEAERIRKDEGLPEVPEEAIQAEGPPRGEAEPPPPPGEAGPAGRPEALPREEVGPKPAAPKPGEKFLVYRLGDKGILDNRNAGNATAVARYIMGTEDAMGPISSKAQKVFAYEVELERPFGKYEGMAGGKKGATAGPGRAVRGEEVAYSFPEGGGWKSKLIGVRSLDELRAELKKHGAASFDDAGSRLGAKAIRNAFGSEAPARATAAVEFTPAPGLSAEMRAVEQRMAAQVLRDPERAMQRYDNLPDTEGGKILNTDLARELSSDYAASKASRARYAAAVHEPASALVKALYMKKLAQPPAQGELPMVTFTAGGTGAGKTGAISRTRLAAEISRVSQIVYDTNMNTLKSSIEKIELALAAGKRATVIYVGRDPVESLRGAIIRAKKIGRTVPITEHAKTHTGAPAVSAELMKRYKGDDRVAFVHIDNSGAKGEVRVVEPADAPAYLKSFDTDNLLERLHHELETQRQAGNVPAEIYKGFAGDAARPGGEVPGGARVEVAPGEHGQLPEGGREKAGVTEPDALAEAARDYVDTHPEQLISVGEDATGKPIGKSLKDFLADALAEANAAREDANLVRAAARCLYGA